MSIKCLTQQTANTYSYNGHVDHQFKRISEILFAILSVDVFPPITLSLQSQKHLQPRYMNGGGGCFFGNLRFCQIVWDMCHAHKCATIFLNVKWIQAWGNHLSYLLKKESVSWQLDHGKVCLEISRVIKEGNRNLVELHWYIPCIHMSAFTSCKISIAPFTREVTASFVCFGSRQRK